MHESIVYNYYNSPIGVLELASNGEQLLSVSYLETNKASKTTQASTESILFKNTKEQLNAYFNSELKVFQLPLNMSGSSFQKKVWQQLTSIPFGKTISYLTLSKQIGNVKAIRAAASANGKNPYCIVIPCHRVIGTNGSLTGYSGDIWRKKWLLEHEAKNTNIQTNLF